MSGSAKPLFLKTLSPLPGVPGPWVYIPKKGRGEVTGVGPRSPRFPNSYRRRPCVLSNFSKLLGQASPPLVPSAETATAPSLREDNGFSEHLAQLTRFNCSFLIPSRDFEPLSSRAAARVQGGLPSLGAQTTKLSALPADAPPRGSAAHGGLARPRGPGLRGASAIQEPRPPGLAGPGSSGSGSEARRGAAPEGRGQCLWKK